MKVYRILIIIVGIAVLLSILTLKEKNEDITIEAPITPIKAVDTSDEVVNYEEYSLTLDAEEPYINIMEFGAIPNDGLDDSASINQAIIEAVNRGIKVIVLPSGELHISDTIILEHNISLMGSGDTNIIILNELEALFDITEVSHIKLCGITIDNKNFKLHDIIYGVGAKASEDVVIEHIHSSNGGRSFIYVKNIQNLSLSNNIIKDTSYRAMNIYNPNNLTIDSNSVDTNASDFGINVEAGSVGVYEMKDVFITNNVVKNTEDGGITVRALRNSMHSIIISNNKIINTGKAAIKATIEVGYENTSLYNIKIYENEINRFANNYKEAGITVSDYNGKMNVYDAEVYNNTIIGTGNSFYGMRFQGSKNIRVHNNTLKDGFLDSGILVENSKDIILENNLVQDSCIQKKANVIQGGVLLSMSENCTLLGNTIKNNGTKSNPAIGILVYRTIKSEISNNYIFEDLDEKSQKHAIYESDEGGSENWSKENVFINNYLSDEGNIVISERSVYKP
ncbi:MAG: hypothetical protein CVV02_09235 [Firmicutes bacterium HGW-Firmicutes-7]|nr:MAG: hypothetical protein CVV02_09235 [Firmicutes bacterium HGW-Firmicutes-7]